MSSLQQQYRTETGRDPIVGSYHYNDCYVRWLEERAATVGAVAERPTTGQVPPLVCDGCGCEMDECNKVNLCHDCYSRVAD
jgi:hypothetical protein